MISSVSLDNIYLFVAKSLLTYGNQTNPRGLPCIELNPGTFELKDPRMNILTNQTRKINKAYAAAELFWILTSRNDVAFLDAYNPHVKQWSDNGKTFNGAYGPRVMPQWNYVLNKIKEDPDTRQAIMTIWTPNPTPSKDIPCTIALHFMQRRGALNLIVYMRSNDFWLGLPYDVHTFTCMQILMAGMLDLKIGWYKHIAGSLHHYQTAQDLHSLMYNARPPRVICAKTPQVFPLAKNHFTRYLDAVEDVHEMLVKNPEDHRISRIMDQLPDFFRQKLEWMREYRRNKKCN